MTGQRLAELALEVLPKKWGYIYGTAGVLWTAEKQAEIEKTTDESRSASRKYGSKWIGHYVADCSGLVKYLCRQLHVTVPHGSNSIWDGYVRKKGFLVGQEIPVGALVFKVRNNDYYHVGIYVGNGEVVEAQGTRTGVVKSKLSDWSNYALLKELSYPEQNTDEPLTPGKAEVDVPNDGTVNIRKSASKDSAKVGTLREGERCEVLSVNGGWAEVEYTMKGYIMTRFLKNVKEGGA